MLLYYTSFSFLTATVSFSLLTFFFPRKSPLTVERTVCSSTKGHHQDTTTASYSNRHRRAKLQRCLLTRIRKSHAIKLSIALEMASDRRKRYLEERRQKCKQHLRKAYAVRKQQQAAEQEWRARAANQLLQKFKIARRLRTRYVYFQHTPLDW